MQLVTANEFFGLHQEKLAAERKAEELQESCYRYEYSFGIQKMTTTFEEEFENMPVNFEHPIHRDEWNFIVNYFKDWHPPKAPPLNPNESGTKDDK